jgi:hypothetical protein
LVNSSWPKQENYCCICSLRSRWDPHPGLKHSSVSIYHQLSWSSKTLIIYFNTIKF